MRRRLAVAMLAAVATVAALLPLGAPFGPEVAGEAQAANASDFDPGYIVSDANFYNGRVMTASAVQSFLNQQQPGCRSGYTCLNGYSQRTPTMADDRYCSAYQGSASESAASIIARVGAACGISQRALIVLLQKEQSLVTSTSPTSTQYNSATGFGCPDTAPCDSSYGGFFYQVYYAARQFEVYRLNPSSFGYHAGQTNRILWHPNTACGTSSVYIRNAATAGLYIYTPYRPNPAALANLYGTGDSCSTYGNRNFWRMWTDWFGDPTGNASAAGNFLRNAANGNTYLIANGTRHYIPNPAIFNEYSSLGNVTNVSAATLEAIPRGWDLGRVVQVQGGAYLLVDDGVAHRFSGCTQVHAFGFSCLRIPLLSSAQASALGNGEAVRSIIRGSDGHLWLVQNDTRREVADIAILARYGYGRASVGLDPEVYAHLPVGAPVISAGMAVRSAGGWLVLVQTSNGIYRFSPEQAQNGGYAGATVFASESLSQLTPGLGNLPSRMRVGSETYLLTSRGVLRVSPGAYGGTSRFTSVPSTVLAALQSAGTSSGPHFVQPRGGAIYLASGSSLTRVADTAAYDFIRARYGVPARIHVVPASALATVLASQSVVTATAASVDDVTDDIADELTQPPDLDAQDPIELTSGQVVQQEGSSLLQVVNDDALLDLQQESIVTDLGLDPTPEFLSEADLADLDVEGAMDAPMVLCGDAAAIGVAGELVPVTDVALDEYPDTAFTELDEDFCELLGLPQGTDEVDGDDGSPSEGAWVTQLLEDEDGVVYFVEDGERHELVDAALERLVVDEAAVTAVGETVLAAIPDGEVWAE